MRTLRVVSGLVLLAATAGAQTVTSRKTLTLEGARKAIAAAQAEARKSNAMGVVAVVDEGGSLVALERLDGTFPAGANVSIGKARTAALFKRPTRVFEEIVAKGRTVMVALDDFTPLQGGVPIVAGGEVVGGIGVSGAASAQQDEDLALAGAAALAEAETHAPVGYIGSGDVAAAFAKGQPLVEQENYKVHASRRDGAGQAELHEADTDIIHVLTGTATLVTGGTVVGGRPAGTEEVRGTSIAGGTERRLAPGDVVIVPAGTPHWFRDVPAPLTYFVVKVRRAGGAR